MTDGILLAETQGDPLLSAYDTLIIDEAHERSLNIDFLLGYLRQLLPRRPDLKLIVTSATLDAERFAQPLRHRATSPAPVIEVSGRLYPIEMRYRPVERDEPKPAPPRAHARQDSRGPDRDLNDALVDAVDEAQRSGPGDVLVFLPGEREIREAAEAPAQAPTTPPAPRSCRCSPASRPRSRRGCSRRPEGRRVVLATNVAETSLTVPGIRYVVDTGLARVKRYSHRNKVEQLQIEKIAQAAAHQRAGRCGRVSRRHLLPALRRGRLQQAPGPHRPGNPALLAGRRDPADEVAAAWARWPTSPSSTRRCRAWWPTATSCWPSWARSRRPRAGRR